MEHLVVFIRSRARRLLRKALLPFMGSEYEETTMAFEYPGRRINLATLSVFFWTLVYLLGMAILLHFLDLLADIKARDNRSWLTLSVYACLYWGAWTAYF